jgi:aspartate/methionine/tyrosine aminotransferase
VVNFPHNPTGALPAREEFEALIDRLRPRGIRLLSDEMYRYLEADPAARLPAACEIYERAVSLAGLSKAFGLAGLRIGWLASRDRETLSRVAALKDYTTICASAPSEILALVALRNRAEILARQRERVRSNLQVLEAFLSRHARGLEYRAPAGGSVCVPRLRYAEGAAVFCERLVRTAGIMLVPSGLFGYGDRHVRIGFGRRDLPEVLDCFSEYLDRYEA